jgi:hypothetical protein
MSGKALQLPLLVWEGVRPEEVSVNDPAGVSKAGGPAFPGARNQLPPGMSRGSGSPTIRSGMRGQGSCEEAGVTGCCVGLFL